MTCADKRPRAPAAPARRKVARWKHGGAPAGACRGEAEEREEGPGLLASPAFWIGGLVCLASWFVAALLFGLI